MNKYLASKMVHDPLVNERVFWVLRQLKKINPGDTYLEAYEHHYKNWGDKFLDYYHILYFIPHLNKVMEIGTRTGISLCQLLNAKRGDLPSKVVSFDLFNDGFISPNLVRANLKHLGIDLEPVFISGNSRETVPAYAKNFPNDKFDLIIVDGDHSREGATADLLNVEPMLSDHGIIIFDDISTAPGECGLIDVWNKFKGGREDKYFWLESMVGKGFGLAIKK